MVVHGHFWTSGCSGAILQWFGFKLSVRASRVAKILKLCFGSVLQLSRCSALAITHWIPKVLKQWISIDMTSLWSTRSSWARIDTKCRPYRRLNVWQHCQHSHPSLPSWNKYMDHSWKLTYTTILLLSYCTSKRWTPAFRRTTSYRGLMRQRSPGSTPSVMKGWIIQSVMKSQTIQVK